MNKLWLLKFTAIAVIVPAVCGWMAPRGQAENAANQHSPAPQADFWVAPDGKDANPGTGAAPFATLARARTAVRDKVAAGLAKDILVLIRGGTYEQADTLVFGPLDSGTEEHSITYAACPGERVVVSGGRKITGWKKRDGEIWTTEIPEVTAGDWYFRQLFINGKRAIRARTPNIDDQSPWWNITTATPASEDALITVGVTEPIKAWRNPTDIELVFIFNNECRRQRLASVNEPEQTLTLAPHHLIPENQNDKFVSVPSAGKACYLENALEFLDRPGEWYLDRRTGILSYWPSVGEDLTRAEVVAPVVQKTLVAVIGTPELLVRNLHFQGIHAECVDWPLPPNGYSGTYGCFLFVGKDTPRRLMDAAVDYEHARACHFVDGGIAHVGGMGLAMRKGTADITVEGNEIYDLGAGGIGAGEMRFYNLQEHFGTPPQQGEYKGYRIANNYVHDCGLDYFGAIGIFISLTQEALVAHNLVHDTAYTGISVLGDDDNDSQFAKNNTIEYNHIYHSMKVCSDGAGLYLIFHQAGQGAVIRGNLIHDVQCNPFNTRTGYCFGVYADVLVKNYHLENNIVYRRSAEVPKGAPVEPLFLLGCKIEDNTFLDNIILKNGVLPPPEFTEIVEAWTGLEASYRRTLLKTASPAGNRYLLTESSRQNDVWIVYQFDRPQAGDGVVEVFRRSEAQTDSARFKLRGLEAASQYEIKLSVAAVGQDLLAGPPAPNAESAVLAGQTRRTGQQMMEEGLLVTAQPAQVVWMVYQRVETR